MGIGSVSGDFARGAPVRIVDPEGVEIARALVNYPSDDLRKILGCRTSRIAEVLGRGEYEEVVHRDNLVLSESRR